MLHLSKMKRILSYRLVHPALCKFGAMSEEALCTQPFWPRILSRSTDGASSKGYLYILRQILSHRLAQPILCNVGAEPEHLCTQPLWLRILTRVIDEAPSMA